MRIIRSHVNVRNFRIADGIENYDLLVAMKTVVSGKSFTVPPGISVKPTITISGLVDHSWDVTDSLQPGESFSLRFVASYEQSLGRYVTDTLEIAMVPNGPEITGVVLRQLRIQEMLRYASAVGAVAIDKSLDADWLVDQHPELFRDTWASKPGGKGPADVVLKAVAVAYRRAEIMSEPPARIVGELFMIPPRTATNWIRRSRERGYFEGF